MNNSQTLQTKKLLEKSGLRFTSCRLELLDYFISHSDTAVSENEINKKFGEDYDRVTVYRTLKSFTEKGILHKVMSESGSRYAISSGEEHHGSGHDHAHVHFQCTSCEITVCLPDSDVGKLKLPGGYAIHESNLLVKGLCNKCNVHE